jgi:hypothetical protein
MTTIVVSGALANRCLNGGGAWVRLNWILGFQRLGCRVYFVEEIKQATCQDAAGAPCAFADSVNLAYFKEITRQFGLDETAALIYEGGQEIHGPGQAELLALAESADLLVNISGHLACEPFFSRFRRKAFLDIDPGFTQIWHAGGITGARLAGHDKYFTIGENIGTPACSIATNGMSWERVRPPVVLPEWPVTSAAADRRFTTVASWRGPYGPVQYQGKTFGLKVHEFRKVFALPERSRQPDGSPCQFEIALNIHPADEKDLQALLRHGWRITNPRQAAGDPASFRRYVQDSAAEFSPAQAIYVETGSGWFSDRTVCYLASGKPALVQDTGFSRNYPVGEGLLAFRTLDEAVAGAEAIFRDYEKHCRAAREIAEAFFDSDKVLSRFLKEVGVAMLR